MLTDQTILEQLSACKIALNRHREVEELLSQKVGSANGDLRYYLGVNYAAQGKFEECLAELISVLKNNPSHKMAKHLAFKLLLNQARQKIKEKDISSISSVLSLAVELAPDTPDAQKELSYFKNALPISHIKAGKREAAAKIWEEELRKHPMDYSLIHNLALLYYWWALNEEAKTAETSKSGTVGDICRIWEKSISCWVMLLSMSDFWNEWKKEKEGIWNLEIKAEDLEEFRESFLEEKFIKIFNDYIDSYKQNGKEQDSSRYENYILTLLLEKESSRCWKETFDVLNDWKDALGVSLDVGIKRYELIRAIQKAEGNTSCFGTVRDCSNDTNECLWSKYCLSDRNRELFFNMPAGYQFFRDFEMLPEVSKLIELLQKVNPDNESIGRLRIYLHRGGLGKVLILLEQRKKPHLAIAELQRLLDSKSVDKGALDVKYIYALAHTERGRLSYKQGNKFNEALDDWTFAQGVVTDAQKLANFEGNPCFGKFLASLKGEIESLVVSCSEKEAKKYKQADKLDDAISVLLKGLKIVTHPANKSLNEHIAIFYCEKGDKKIADKSFSGARNDFEEALKYSPNYDRAKKGIGTAYNNEGVSKSSPDESLPLFEKAIQYDPDSNVVKENLAGACNGKAISILNSLTPGSSQNEYDRAINLLKKAVKILNPSLEESSINLILEYDSEKEIEKITKDMKDSLYKTVLKNLSLAGNYRRYNIAGDYNKRAVDIINSLTQYSSYSKCDEAIDLLKQAVKILNPSFNMSLIDSFAYTEEWQFKNLTSNLPNDLYKTVLHNLWVACRSRKNLRGY
jgi:tetratricopeptide (TPR) repeat protein